MHRGDLAGARAACAEVLRAAPGDTGVLLLVADIAFRSGEYADAIACLRQGLAANPGAADVHYKLGCLHEDSRDPAAAAAAYEEAIRLNPSLSKAHNNLGAVLQGMGRMDEALASFQAAHTLDPGLWIAQYNIGQWQKLQGNLAAAVAPFQQAMRGRRDVALPVLDSSALETCATHAKLRHDIEQMDYLVRLGILGDLGRSASKALAQTLAALGPEAQPAVAVEFPAHVKPVVAPYFNRLLHFHDAPALAGGAVNPDLDWAAIEAGYFANGPGMTFVDDFLRPEALASLRRFCLESTIWFDAGYGGGYVGCTFEHGFACPLLAQIADEFRRALPGIFGDARVTGLWGYKYDSERSGIAPHGDFAAVNVNFWLTPDDANLAPESGGLVVWDKEAPLDWDFEDYNNNQERIGLFLRESDARPYVVPHRQNRVVLFNSDLFHKTDSYRFKPGYENRRINVTMLYGDRQQAPAG
ncbi:MAG: tetratricopeptide repeat protein [Burkholderiales bacterium]|nr:tetratricopeptide repeat protein [Burkholderiales bacterium]